MEGLAFFLGACLGVVLICFVSVFFWTPMSHDYQFEKDCKTMAHGSVDKSAKTVCVKDGKILFHE